VEVPPIMPGTEACVGRLIFDHMHEPAFWQIATEGTFMAACPLPGQVGEERQLEEENGKLKKIVADLSLDKEMLQDVSRDRFISHRASNFFRTLPEADIRSCRSVWSLRADFVAEVV